MNSNGKKENEWDFIKGVLIVFVIWGHCCAYLSGVKYEKNLLTTYIRLFQMPLFILVSGYFQKPVYTIRELIGKYKKSIINIAVPYVTWTCIYYAFMLISKRLIGEQINFSVLGIIKSFSFLWFLGCILICQFVFNTLSYIWHRNRNLGIVLLSCSLICFLSIGGGVFKFISFSFSLAILHSWVRLTKV